MGATKYEIFHDQINEEAAIFNALGHPARLAIVKTLLTYKTCVGNYLTNEIHLSQPTISQHLKVLKNAGIIQGTIEGKSVCYCLNHSLIERLRVFVGDMLIQYDLHQTNCNC
jgi:DNA-binding transcriptional ArsR family regulator